MNVRQWIPVVSVPYNKPSLWSRVRTAAAIVVDKTRAVVSRVSRALSSKGQVGKWLKDAWVRGVKPFVRVRMAAVAVGATVVALVAAPVATVVWFSVAGLALLGVAKGIARLEAGGHTTLLGVIEAVARAAYWALFAITVGVVLFLSITSLVFAVTELFELVLRLADVTRAVSIAALAFFVLTGNWAFAVLEAGWLGYVTQDARKTRSAAQRRQEIPTLKFIDVDGSESRSDMSVCEGCGVMDGGGRYRALGMSSALCDSCFACWAEDELITAADAGLLNPYEVEVAVESGVNVPAYVVIKSGAKLRSVRIDLDREAVTCRTKARIDSKGDASKIHWAETAWWFDGRGNKRARRWHGFVDGVIRSVISYEHARDIRGFYVMEPSGESRAYHTLEGAQMTVATLISDARIAGKATPCDAQPLRVIREVS